MVVTLSAPPEALPADTYPVRHRICWEQAAMRGRLADFERDERSALLPTSAIYRRRDGDWASGEPA